MHNCASMRALLLGLFPFSGLLSIVHAALIGVPNHSFESPVTSLASPSLEAWQKAPQPSWYDDQGGFFPWDQLMGEFLNTPESRPDHIDNAEGQQAAYLFALPRVALWQDYDATPAHDFNARFEVGRSYTLTVGLLGGGGGMSNGATFQISLYYRDAASNMVTVAATTITNSKSLFSTNTHLTDFQVLVPTVKPNDAWAGKNLGIQLSSTVGFDLAGGILGPGQRAFAGCARSYPDRTHARQWPVHADVGKRSGTIRDPGRH